LGLAKEGIQSDLPRKGTECRRVKQGGEFKKGGKGKKIYCSTGIWCEPLSLKGVKGRIVPYQGERKE